MPRPTVFAQCPRLSRFATLSAAACLPLSPCVSQEARAATGAPHAATQASVSVRYERLSSVVQAAESQKDVLLQVLRETQGSSFVYLEWDEENETSEPGRRIVLRCVACQSPHVGDGLLTETLETTRLQQKPRKERVRFEVGTPGDPTHTAAWVVEIEERKPIFVVRAARAFGAGDALSAASANVQTCFDTSACRGDAAFTTEEQAQAFHASLEGRESVRGLAAGTALAPRDTRPAVLVRQGDPVRVSVRTGAAGLSIRANARALQTGSAGDTINVEMDGAGMRQRAGTRSTLRTTIRAKGEVDYVVD